MTTITVTSKGRRHYLTGNTYPIRDQLRAAGAHWDADRKAWWTAKRDVADQIAASAAPASAAPSAPQSKTPRDGLDSVVAGRVKYKGRTYYLAGRTVRGHTHWDDTVDAVRTSDRAKLLLYFRDGSSQLWASAAEVTVEKHYDRPQTIKSLRAFAEQAKQSRDNGSDWHSDHGWRNNGCSECRRIGDWCDRCAFDEFDC